MPGPASDHDAGSAVRTPDRVRWRRLDPEMGRIVPEFGPQFLRELIHPPFRIVYRREPKYVRIVRIWRSERLLRLTPGDDSSLRPNGERERLPSQHRFMTELIADVLHRIREHPGNRIDESKEFESHPCVAGNPMHRARA